MVLCEAASLPTYFSRLPKISIHERKRGHTETHKTIIGIELESILWSRGERLENLRSELFLGLKSPSTLCQLLVGWLIGLSRGRPKVNVWRTPYDMMCIDEAANSQRLTRERLPR